MAFVLPAVGMAAGLGSTIIGSAEASAAQSDADQARQNAVQQWLSVNVPSVAEQQIELQNYKVTGQLSPQYQSAFQQSQTNLKNMPVDQTGRSAEVNALGEMGQLANNGGLDAQAEQQVQQAINQTNANTQGQMQAVVQNAAARGVGGSGAQMAAELLASQGGANSAAQAGQAAAAADETRALQAMSNESTAGNALNASDYGEAAAAAQAQDQINRFNTQNAQSVQNSNVTAANAAQAANLANAQSVANANTGVANQQETYNKGLVQQDFNDQSQVASGVANAYAGQANQFNTDATNTANQWDSIGQAASAGVGAINKAAQSSNSSNSDNSYSGDTFTDQNGNALSSSDMTPGSSTFNGPVAEAEGGKVADAPDFLNILKAAQLAKVMKNAA